MKDVQHHAIVYVKNNITDVDILKFKAGSNFQNLFQATERGSASMFEQCNGPIASLTTQDLLVIIPKDYIDEDEDYIQKWIYAVNQMGFSNISYEGVMDLNVVPVSMYTKNVSIPNCLRNNYNKSKGFEEGYLFKVKRILDWTNHSNYAYYQDIYLLGGLSLLRTLYIPYYKEIIPETYLLHEMYPKEDLFKLFCFAFFTVKTATRYRSYCNGSYNFVQLFTITDPKLALHLINVELSTYQEFLKKFDKTARLNMCTYMNPAKNLNLNKNIGKEKEVEELGKSYIESIKLKNIELFEKTLNALRVIHG